MKKRMNMSMRTQSFKSFPLEIWAWKNIGWALHKKMLFVILKTFVYIVLLIHLCECRYRHATVHVSKSEDNLGSNLPRCLRQCLSCCLQLHCVHKARPPENLQGFSCLHLRHLCRNSVISGICAHNLSSLWFLGIRTHVLVLLPTEPSP